MLQYSSERLAELVGLIARGLPDSVDRNDLKTQVDSAVKAVISERYRSRIQYQPRVRYAPDESGIPFAGLIHADEPTSGVYGGMSLIWFPVPGDDGSGSSLLTFVCGTRGLAPDEQILGRPGHARHLQALRRLLSDYGIPGMWVKPDPTNLSQDVPQIMKLRLQQYGKALGKYGPWTYAAVEVPKEESSACLVVGAFLDLYAWERGWQTMADFRHEVERLQNELRSRVFPKVSQEQVHELLKERRFVVLQGPPGTGKTKMALDMKKEDFVGNGNTVQFHAAVTYETFVAGIMPTVESGALGFRVRSGWLVDAIEAARSSGKDYLLHVDEINRADLGRVLGEAIYLFEPQEIGRTVKLPQPLADGTRELSIPNNLYILGTMNSADRSIAILDLAIRRRFAFVDLWPDFDVVRGKCDKVGALGDLPWQAFGRLQDIFAQYALEDSLVLLPGHAYFLADGPEQFRRKMQHDLIPLLQEYLLEGRLGLLESELQAYLIWLEGELSSYGSA